jgi:hypothetical protein
MARSGATAGALVVIGLLWPAPHAPAQPAANGTPGVQPTRCGTRARWTRLPSFPGATVGGSYVVHDAANRQLLLFGGRPETTLEQGTIELWALSLLPDQAPRWRRLATAGTPPPRWATTGVAYDPGSQRLFALSASILGTGPPTIAVLSLAATPATWETLTPVGRPPPRRFDYRVWFDAAGERLVVHDGLDGPMHDMQRFAGVWALPLRPAGAPRWQALPGGARGRVDQWAPSIVAGGAIVTAAARAGSELLTELWTLPLSLPARRWTHLPIEGGAPPRTGGNGAIHDRANNRLILFGDFDRKAGHSSDVFALSLDPAEQRRWVRLEVDGEQPVPERWYDLTYDSVALTMIAVGANGSDHDAPGPVWALALPRCR